MKILITGANGLLGSNLVRQLLQENFEVKAMVRESSDLRSLKNTNPELFKGNLLDSGDLKKALPGCKLVVHVAANTAQWPSGYQHYKKINVEGTRLLLEESKKAGIEQFIFVSSANTFGPGTKEAPGDETSPFTSIQHQSGYMRSKYEAQQLVLDFERIYKFPAVVVNPTFMLGKYDAKPSSGQMLLMAHGKQLMPCPPGGRNFIHVKDVATGIIRAIEQGKPGNCYLLGNENLSYLELFRMMRKVCGFPKKLIQLPGTIMSAAGYAGTLYEKITGKPSKLNHTTARILSADNYYSSEKAIRDFQLPKTPVEQAIEDALSWFEDHGYLA